MALITLRMGRINAKALDFRESGSKGMKSERR